MLPIENEILALEAKSLIIQSDLCNSSAATLLWQHNECDGMEWLAHVAREVISHVDEGTQPRLYEASYALMRMAESNETGDDSSEWLAIVKNELA